MKKGIFYGVGVGPGDPELLTLKAVKVLQEVDVVAVPQKGRRAESAAFSVVREHLKGGCRLLKLVFPMTREQKQVEHWHRQACEKIRGHLDNGEKVAFVTIGDPMLYSTYIYLFKRLGAAGYPAVTVPGVPSFCAAAAAAGVPLAEGEEKLALIPFKEGKPFLAETLQRFENAVILKPSGKIYNLVGSLEEAGFLANSVLVTKCGLPGERIEKDLRALCREGQYANLPYFSLILAKKEVSGE